MRPLRQFLPDRAYLITARCFEERFFLAPDSEALNLIVATCLAQAASKFRLDLFAYVVMSNHVHLVVRAPHGGLPEAMQLFLSQVARRVNILRNRRGPVFSDRYHHQTICDEGALHNAIRYVLYNPVRAGAASTTDAWAGLSSFPDTMNDLPLRCSRRQRGRTVLWTVKRLARGEAHLPTNDTPDVASCLLECRPASLLHGAPGTASHEAFVDTI